ncbi:MAG: hypothetical protein KGZ25_08490 [Planctomycetes bacterium]|nr:hypothetical protein [Planctomycetota bacterium]
MSKRLKLLMALALVLLIGGVIEGLWLLKNPSTPALAVRWVEAVQNNEGQKAVRLASKIAREVPDEPKAAYKKLSAREKLDPAFLSAPFSHRDFHRWRSAVVFKMIAEKITRGEKDDIEALFEATADRLESRQNKDKRPLWPLRIWQGRTGLCDRQAWVFCELAYQKGWETQIVYLRDPESGVSHHTIAEVRKDHRVYTVDPYKNRLVEGYSVRMLASRPELIKKNWPESQKFWPEFKNAILWTPAYPQDYAPRNQRLQQILRKEFGEACPRFGEDPEQRLRKYQSLRKHHEVTNKRFPMRLWFYPFRLLRAEMMRNQRKQ